MRIFIKNPNNCLSCGSDEVQEESFNYEKSAHYFCKGWYEAKTKTYNYNKGFNLVLFSKKMKLIKKNYWIFNKINNTF